MKRLLGLGLGATMLALGGLIACSSEGGTSTPSTPDGAAPDAPSSSDSSTGTDSNPPTDAPSDTSASCDPFTRAAPTASAAPQCHDLANDAPEIGTTSDPGTIPTGTGGTIADGLYFLTEVRLYAGSPIGANFKFQQTYLLKGGKSYITERTDTGTSNVTHRKVKSQLVDGGESTDCTSDASHVDPPGSSLTATCNTVTVYVPDYKYAATLTRQK